MLLFFFLILWLLTAFSFSPFSQSFLLNKLVLPVPPHLSPVNHFPYRSFKILGDRAVSMDQSENANQGEEIVKEKEENTRNTGASKCLLRFWQLR